ncbi:nucleoside-diphosphate kinase [Promicromonospora sp. MS192]|uniref:nucleoside-diphosphate kinase n=1 Tax=Promicromonospora sp. MS192 TaxID=3412684 RepID=UPI003C2F7B62
MNLRSIDWSALTRDDAKRYFYAMDTHFREGLSETRSIFGDQWREILFSSALILVKPDGVAAGKFGIIREYFTSRGVQILDLERLKFNRHIHRELWRYQHTLATPDRLAVEELVLRSGHSFLLLARAERPVVPASVHVSELKGAATVEATGQATLRSLLDRPNPLFSMLHTSDEPADLIRELAILVPPTGRHRLWNTLARGKPAIGIEAALDRVERDHSVGVDVALDRSVERVIRIIESCLSDPQYKAAASAALRYIQAARDGIYLPWREFVRLISGLPIGIDTWDLAITGSSYVRFNEEGAEKVLGKTTAAMWEADAHGDDSSALRSMS